MGCQDMAVTHPKVLNQSIAKCLGQTALDLSLYLLDIHSLPYIVYADNAQDTHLTSKRIHLNFDRLGGIGITTVRHCSMGRSIQRSRGRRAILDRCLGLEIVCHAPLLACSHGGISYGSS